MSPSDGECHVLAQQAGGLGLLTLNRPKALNALSLQMVRDLTAQLLSWREDPQVLAVAIRGVGKEGPFGAFCAGGDIRFFHQAALTGDWTLDDFFTEEYTLNHLIHGYAKPIVAFMDGIVMGGGMGIAQGARWRVVTERTRMAMPETAIGLFPDVGGGYFLSRCPGHVGEYLALTGEVIGAQEALRYGLADVQVEAAQLPTLWSDLAAGDFSDSAAVQQWLSQRLEPLSQRARVSSQAHIDAVFGLESVAKIAQALKEQGSDAWASATLAILRKRSPLMLNVVLEQIRRARSMDLADDLRMERDLVRHCFGLRKGTASETVEGIRALAVDKDQAPRWQPARWEDVTPDLVSPFFSSPWPAHAHPLRFLR